MALDRNSLFTLGHRVADANPSAPVAYSFEDKSYSYADLNNAFRAELKDLIGTYALWRENHNTVYTLMEEIITDKLPAKVMQQYGAFAEVKTYRQGEKPVFVQRITEASKRRAKQFIAMPAGLAGRYEVFKLDGRSYEVKTSAMGAACQIAIEEFLDGRIDMATVLDIVMEGMDDRSMLKSQMFLSLLLRIFKMLTRFLLIASLRLKWTLFLQLRTLMETVDRRFIVHLSLLLKCFLTMLGIKEECLIV